MDIKLKKVTVKAIATGLAWLSKQEQTIQTIDDLIAHYKAPYLYSVCGNPVRGRYYAELICKRYLRPDGDFRTEPHWKGWEHLPISPANRYIYPNGWIIMGLQRLGYAAAAQQGLSFIIRFQDPYTGGFYSRFDPKTDAIDIRFIDSSSTSAAGLALLACGRIEPACRAGDFLLSLINSQPEPDTHYYASWEKDKGIMTDVWGNDDPNSIRGRKQFCLTTTSGAINEMTWLIGKPMKFLCRLYDYTNNQTYLEGAIRLFNFFHKLDDSRWDTLTSCKVMWASAELYRHTRNQCYHDTAEQLLRSITAAQYPSGVWVNNLFYQDEKDQPMDAHLDAVQELCAELIDTLFEICM